MTTADTGHEPPEALEIGEDALDGVVGGGMNIGPIGGGPGTIRPTTGGGGGGGGGGTTTPIGGGTDGIQPAKPHV